MWLVGVSKAKPKYLFIVCFVKKRKGLTVNIKTETESDRQDNEINDMLNVKEIEVSM